MTRSSWFAKKDSGQFPSVQSVIVEEVIALRSKLNKICSHSIFGHFKPQLSIWGLSFSCGNCTIKYLQAGSTELTPCAWLCRSGAAAEKLEEAGFESVAYLVNGLQTVKPGKASEWQSRPHPASTNVNLGSDLWHVRVLPSSYLVDVLRDVFWLCLLTRYFSKGGTQGIGRCRKSGPRYHPTTFLSCPWQPSYL